MKKLLNGRCSAPLVAAVVVTVSVEVAALVPEIVAAGAEQPGRSCAPDGLDVTAQLKLTLPVSPPEGVTVSVVVLPLVAPGANVNDVGLVLRAKFGGVVVITMFTVAVSVVDPDVPVTVTV